ncbi:MAG: UDP-N-acetylmuramoyl-tripeptide--D-alanyl-D-alanine ligase [Thermodesulfobacteriota bacterium]
MFNTSKLPWEEWIPGLSGSLIQGNPGQEACGISTDTRTLKKGEIFIALKGPRFDGHDHLRQAFEKGAVAALVDHPPASGMVSADRIVIQVRDTLTALGDLAALWRRKFDLPLVGISGSNGKTTTKEMLASILEKQGPTLKNPGNLNNWIGLPLSLLALNENHRYAVLEMGMNHPGEIDRLCQIARPTIGLLTNIGPAHLEAFGSLSAIAEAKGELFQSLGADHWAAINMDDRLILDQARFCRARQITFGLHPQAQVRAERVEPYDKGSRFLICTPMEVEIDLPLHGNHNVSNALGASAVAVTLGISSEKIRQGLEGFPAPVHRLEIKKGKQGIRLIDDSYNANPASMTAALKVFESLRKGQGGGLVLGDMLELGSRSIEAHREIGRMIGEMGVDFLLTLGEAAGEMADSARQGTRPPRKIFSTRDPKGLIDYLPDTVREGDWVLVKGSHGMNMETIVKHLEEQN